MKIVCFADSHRSLQEITIPKADVLLFAGDEDIYNIQHLAYFVAWLKEQPVKKIVVIAGNHDFMIEKENAFCRQYFKDNKIIYLENSGVTIKGIKIWGSPFTPTFNDWAFMKDRGDPIKKIWDLIPKGTDILLTHGPALNKGDWLPKQGHLGCWDLRYAIETIKPRWHVFGHIHGAAGTYKTQYEPTTFVNCSVMDEQYAVVNLPVVIKT